MHDIDEEDHSAWKLSLSCGAETFSSVDPAIRRVVHSRLVSVSISWQESSNVSSAGMIMAGVTETLPATTRPASAGKSLGIIIFAALTQSF